MKNADLPGKPVRPTASPMDDIPEAIRELPAAKPKGTVSQRSMILGAIAALGVLSLFGLLFFLRPQPSTSQSSQSASAPTGETPATDPASSPNPTDTLLGHFPYKEAPESELVPIVADGSLRLRRAAAEKYKAMVAAAEADGISLMPISAFRSTNDQQSVFFDVKAERAQAATKRAEVSAPPGYSEHHTGYAVDLGDGNVPATDLSPDFEKTAAFKWLVANAARFNFEMSFPRNNPQGVTYEPWHWRFIGDRDSLETFYKARSPK